MFKRKTIVTHSGAFHADDVFAVATLDLIYDGKVKIMRSREPEDFANADIVLDVGAVYDPSQNKFDHHQRGGAGVRENGVPYAGFGLIWKHFGKELAKDEKVWQKVDERLVQPIDASDTGYEDYRSSKPNLHSYVLDTMVTSFNPTWQENYKESYERFIYLVRVAKEIIQREVKRATDAALGEGLVEDAYQKSEDKRIIIIDRGYPWKDILIAKQDVLFVVYPDMQGNKWHAQAVPVSRSSYETRASFPAEWRGLTNSDLTKVTEVSDAAFCHNYGFLAVAGSRDGAILLAQKALSKHTSENK